MARTLEEIRTSVRYEVRDPDGVTHDDVHVDYAINQAYRKVFMDVVNVIEDYFVSSVTFSLVANQREYPLPEDHIRTKRVQYVRGNNKKPLYRRRRHADSVSVTSGGSNSFCEYDFEDENIIFEPPPGRDEEDAIIHEYYRECIDLVDDDDEVDEGFKAIWVDLLVLETAWALQSGLESLGGRVSTDLVDRLKDLRKTFEKTLTVRTLSPQKRRRRGYFQ